MPSSSVFRTKSIEQAIRDTKDPKNRLRRVLSGFDLTLLCIGSVIGSGIFVLTGTVARSTAGPAVSLSFVVSGVVCVLVAMCYAEFASIVPVAGSAYTFAYSSIGELPAWIIGWDITLELVLTGAIVAVGWSGYAQSLLASAGVHLPTALSGGTDTTWGFNLPAVLLTVAVTILLTFGVKASARFSNVIVGIKVAVVLVVIVAGLFFVKASNYAPFIPSSQPATTSAEGLKQPLITWLSGFEPAAFGVMGIFFAAATVFYAYVGFEVVATTAEETKKPQRDLPLGLLAGITIVTLLYIAVSLVVTGMQKYHDLSTKAPLSEAFKAVGHDEFAWVINIGTVIGLTSVTLVMILGQTRVFFAMSRDGLLPAFFRRLSRRSGAPIHSTILLGGIVAIVAGTIPLQELAELVNIGTLAAFVVVSVGVLVLRRTRPDLPRAFRCPWVPVLPVVAACACFWLMLNLPTETWWRFLVWTALGLVVYFTYSRRNSRLAARQPDTAEPGADREVVDHHRQ